MHCDLPLPKGSKSILKYQSIVSVFFYEASWAPGKEWSDRYLSILGFILVSLQVSEQCCPRANFQEILTDGTGTRKCK